MCLRGKKGPAANGKRGRRRDFRMSSIWNRIGAYFVSCIFNGMDSPSSLSTSSSRRNKPWMTDEIIIAQAGECHVQFNPSVAGIIMS
jgi:hypothetical protein